MAHDYPAAGSDESALLRIVAPNPSPMTERGTNSYVLGRTDLAIVDPGPATRAHLDALERAVAGRHVAAILVTHSHLDHSPGAAPLGARLGAPVMAFGPSRAGLSDTMAGLDGLGGGEGVDQDFAPDIALADGEVLRGGDGMTLRAHWIPGHMSNHLAFEWIEARAVFTGDTVMGWASTMISPPDGDMGRFLSSLDRLESLDARVFHPGHGASVDDPAGRCRALRAHRLAREAAILAALDRPRKIPDLVARLYPDTPPALHEAVARNVLAHLIHLQTRGLTGADPGPTPYAVFHRA